MRIIDLIKKSNSSLLALWQIIFCTLLTSYASAEVNLLRKFIDNHYNLSNSEFCELYRSQRFGSYVFEVENYAGTHGINQNYCNNILPQTESKSFKEINISENIKNQRLIEKSFTQSIRGSLLIKATDTLVEFLNSHDNRKTFYSDKMDDYFCAPIDHFCGQFIGEFTHNEESVSNRPDCQYFNFKFVSQNLLPGSGYGKTLSEGKNIACKANESWVFFANQSELKKSIKIEDNNKNDISSNIENLNNEKIDVVELGISITKINNLAGILITDVQKNFTAFNKGIQIGNIIYEINGQSINQPSEFKKMIHEAIDHNQKIIIKLASNRKSKIYTYTTFDFFKSTSEFTFNNPENLNFSDKKNQKNTNNLLPEKNVQIQTQNPSHSDDIKINPTEQKKIDFQSPEPNEQKKSTGITVEKRLALVIGNGSYRYVDALPNPKKDADAIAEMLSDLGFTVIKGFDLDRAGLEALIRTFAKQSNSADLTLFYYAGHGMQIDGKNYIVPIDAKVEDATAAEFELIDTDQKILKYMSSPSKTGIVFLDACRDNPFSKKIAKLASRTTSATRGLAPISTDIGGLLIAFATAPGDVASDGDGPHSPFTTALLKHLPTPGLEIEQAMKRIKKDVQDMTNKEQRPWSNSDLQSEIYLAPLKN